MKDKQQLRTIYLVLAGIFLLVVCGCGLGISTGYMNYAKERCELIDKEELQINPYIYPPSQYQYYPIPKTTAECVDLVEQGAGFYRIWGWVGSCILTIGACMSLYALLMIFAPKQKSK